MNKIQKEEFSIIQGLVKQAKERKDVNLAKFAGVRLMNLNRLLGKKDQANLLLWASENL